MARSLINKDELIIALFRQGMEPRQVAAALGLTPRYVHDRSWKLRTQGQVVPYSVWKCPHGMKAHYERLLAAGVSAAEARELIQRVSDDGLERRQQRHEIQRRRRSA